MLDRIKDFDVVAVDTETTGLHWYRDRMFGVAVAGMDLKTGKIVSKYYDIRTNPRAIEALRHELPQAKRIVNHAMKFDAHFLANEGIVLPDNLIECTLVRAALINEHELSFSLDALCKKYLGTGKVDIYKELAGLFGGKPTRDAQMKNLHRAPERLVAKYATPDAELALRLWEWQQKEMVQQQLMDVWMLERDLTPVLIGMERFGVRVDIDRTVKSMKAIDRKIQSQQRELNQYAGRPVNANSPLQMREMLGPKKNRDGRWQIGGVVLESTGTGQPSIDAEALRRLAAKGNAAAEAALNYRKLTKARSFLHDHIMGHELNGRVFPNYNQTRGDNELGTITGRFSINDPALQQIPARDVEIASIVRACFVPEDGHDWTCNDWDQFEFRWFAHYTNDERILDVYKKSPDADFHKIAAELTGLPRSARYAGDANAKQINLGLVFGMGDGTLAEEMGLEYKIESRYGREFKVPGPEAKAIFKKYHAAIPGVRELLDQASSIARSRGYVRTVMGRHIRFPGGKFTHKAGGLVFQGSSADSIKRKMVELYALCKKKYGTHMLLSVHDELDFSTPKGKQGDEARAEIKRVLETFDGVECPIKCRVPIKSSIGVGKNWWDASK